MQYAVSVNVEAPAAAIWAVLTDVERWPDWTASITRVERLDSGPLQVGSRARIRQPRLAVAVWTVTDVEPLRSFSWTTGFPGITSIADHRLSPRPGGGMTVTLSIRLRGLLAPIVGVLYGGLTRRYLQTEAQGLKRQTELRTG